MKNLTTLRALLAAVLEGRTRLVLISVVLMVGGGLFEGVGVVLLVPLMGLVGLDLGGGSLAGLAGVVSSAFDALGLEPSLQLVLATYVLVLSTQAVLDRRRTVAGIDLVHGFLLDLQGRLFRALGRTRWIEFCRYRATDLAHVLTDEVDRIGVATDYLLSLLATSLVTVVYVGLAFRISPSATGAVCACGLAVWVLLRAKVRSARLSGEDYTTACRELRAAVIEHLGAMRTTRSYDAGPRSNAIFESRARAVADVERRSTLEQTDLHVGGRVLSFAILCALLYLLVEVLAVSTPAILLLLFLFSRIMPRLATLQQSYQVLVNELPAFESYQEALERARRAAEPPVGREQTVRFEEEIRLEGVSFRYGEGRTALEGLDLRIPARRTTALVGPSGSGKSTVVDLVVGLIAPEAGRILIDGVPLGPAGLRSWRSRIGYVSQETFLFHDTVRANLLWACPEADDDRIGRALAAAGARGFLDALPDGLDTVLGDRGVLVSGGERQRLALARALLRAPTLLILDEATSALDLGIERRILDALAAVEEPLTILIVTHRLSSVRGADVIHVLEEGRHKATGDWDSLLAGPIPTFRDWCQSP